MPSATSGWRSPRSATGRRKDHVTVRSMLCRRTGAWYVADVETCVHCAPPWSGAIELLPGARASPGSLVPPPALRKVPLRPTPEGEGLTGRSCRLAGRCRVRHGRTASEPPDHRRVNILYPSPTPTAVPASRLCWLRTSQTPAGQRCLAHMPAESGSFVRSPSASPREPAGSYAPEYRLLDRSLTCLHDRTTVPGARHGLVNRGTLPMSVPPILNVYRHDTDNRALVTLTGEIDLNSAPLVHASLERCLHDGIRTIAVDVTAVTFCDCSGLNAFLYALLAHRRCRRIPATAPPQPGAGTPRRPHRLRLPLPW
ncbi:STAS domain-containing protein [Streptomyces sp. NPDC002758]